MGHVWDDVLASSMVDGGPMAFIYGGFSALVGLVLGSFSSVVIYRLPRMMEAAWLREHFRAGGEDGESEAEEQAERFDLVLPGSSCAHCGQKIPYRYNIPILGYLWLRGRCSSCGGSIDSRYWVLELMGAVLALIMMLHFGPGWAWVGSLVLTFGLLILAFIDIDHQLLPDQLTLPLIWMGLILSVFGVYIDSESSIIGAVLGYGFLWSIHRLFFSLTGREGVGRGDFKLLALLGAWVGWSPLPFIVFLSSILGALFGLLLIFMGRRTRTDPIPYGPFLAFSGWLALVFGQTLGLDLWRLAEG